MMTLTFSSIRRLTPICDTAMPSCSLLIAVVKLLLASSSSDCVLRLSANCVNRLLFLCRIASALSSVSAASDLSISARLTSA
jgi:hypothetical protein